MLMISGETVKVSCLTKGVEDAFGNEVESYSDPESVENVLVGRGNQYDEYEGGRPDAMRTDITFCFPRGWSKDLRGARIKRKGKTYEVVGDPVEYTEANLPPGIPWNIRVGAVWRDG